MADAGQNHSTKKIGLGEALLRLTPDPPDVEQPSLPISFVFWNKRELAIQQLDAAIDAGDLPLFAFNEKTGKLIQILALRWREHQPGWHRDMIISGAVKTSVGDAKLWIHYKDEDCRLVLLADDFDAWLERFAQKSAAAISVSATPATANHAVAEPVRREHAESFDKGIPDVNMSPSSDHPGDSPTEAPTRAFLANLMREDHKNSKGRSKDEIKEECQKKFGVSNRAFNIIWTACIQETGAVEYKKRGPRGAHKARRRRK